MGLQVGRVDTYLTRPQRACLELPPSPYNAISLESYHIGAACTISTRFRWTWNPTVCTMCTILKHYTWQDACYILLMKIELLFLPSLILSLRNWLIFDKSRCSDSHDFPGTEGCTLYQLILWWFRRWNNGIFRQWSFYTFTDRLQKLAVCLILPNTCQYTTVHLASFRCLEPHRIQLTCWAMCL